MKLKFYILFLIILTSFSGFAQNHGVISGTIVDTLGFPIASVNIGSLNLPQQIGTVSGKDGYFEFSAPSNIELIIGFSYIGYKPERYILKLAPNEKKQINIVLKSSVEIIDVVPIFGRQKREPGMDKINPKDANVLPGPGEGIEYLLKIIGTGVSSSNELSSQYSVRGGNYDENLVYVNDIEIYRPFLVRSGQQEGLSFANTAMVSSVEFSAGGFDAKYGDKMSSVLDIKYKEPNSFAASVGMSLLGFSTHVEGCSDNYRFTYLFGIRQKSNQYVLKSMETKGEYKPSFSDFQTFLTYDITEFWEIGFLGNYARNSYKVVPENRETEFGTINEALRLSVYFDGQEVDRFETFMGALTTTYKPNKDFNIRFTSSAFNTYESETYDIMGQYWLDELENDFGKDEFGNVKYNRGVGTYLNHARNYLEATVFNVEHRGSLRKVNKLMQWGVKYQAELIKDELSEWRMLDSAGYSIPHPPDYINFPVNPNKDILLQEVIKAKFDTMSNRYSGFFQNKWNLNTDSVGFTITAGLRANYWDLNKEFLLSPRASFTFTPNWEKDIVFRFATGIYYQPPFYKELRYFDGSINTNIKAQRSIHFVAASEWNFDAWYRPFVFSSEIYYKQLNNLIPYEIDNVRIRYFAENSAHGYATGIDLKVNGEFVKGIESWASLSVMKTEEDIDGDFYYDYYNQSGEKIVAGYTYDAVAVDSIRNEPGYIARPTDQRVNFSLFFQDYLPRNPTYKMHLNLVFGSRLPFGPPTHKRYQATLRIPPYRRVDIGFSKQIKSADSKLRAKSPFRHFNEIWLSLEVFNLLQINNTVSYLWIADVSNRMYAVPNYLTPRQLNLKLHIDM
ncbi:MAG: carboxypeptidase-like regulatory domain-containing protein [Saprospiraceae bacterium]|nr:carboxypeptidase-like regulatory domain-containing protein [Saprospiraceae bacterium]